MTEKDNEPTRVEPIDVEPDPNDIGPILPLTPDYSSPRRGYLGINPWMANVIFFGGLVASVIGFVVLGRWMVGAANMGSEFALILIVSVPVALAVVGVLWARSRTEGRTVGGSLAAGLVSGGCALVCLAIGLALLIAGFCFVALARN
ncbi:MAG: hypothetical protein AAGD32_06065 [Planctomycetota bacterium]